MANLYLDDKAAFDAALEATKNGGKPLLLVFTTKCCPPCQIIASIFERLIGENVDAVTMKKVDLDANSEAAQAAGIKCMPTFKLYMNGAEVEKLEGSSESCINDLINKAKKSSSSQQEKNPQEHVAPSQEVKAQILDEGVRKHFSEICNHVRLIFSKLCRKSKSQFAGLASSSLTLGKAGLGSIRAMTS